MRLIDADLMVELIKAQITTNEDDKSTAGMAAKRVMGRLIEFVNDLPTAQPEIIRCKECKYQVKEWREDKRLKENGYWVYGCRVLSEICGYWAWFGQDDEFCSEAERRTDG